MPARHIDASWGHQAHRQRPGQAEEGGMQPGDSLVVGRRMVYFAKGIGACQGFAHRGVPGGGTGSWDLGTEAGPYLGI